MVLSVGKAVWLHSSDGPETTTIDARQGGTVVTCENGEGSGTVLEGFTITNGASPEGGGMYNSNSSPTVTNCILWQDTPDEPSVPSKRKRPWRWA